MPRKYHMHNASQFPEPSVGVPMHTLRRQGSEKAADDEIIFPTEINTSGKKEAPPVKNDRLFGQLKTDDIILLCIILLVLQDDELDTGLLLALGYIFLSDKTFDAL